MKRVGAHVSISGGVQNAPVNAKNIGAKAFAMFTKNQRQWHAKAYPSSTIDAFHKAMEENGYKAEHVLPHDSYLINIGSPVADMYEKSFKAFVDELSRCDQLGLKFL
ncbi:MAG: TIM barrel protein, partial [Chitinispirillaceae bacterium]